jgi:MYXO-CTERM domain-containing protein
MLLEKHPFLSYPESSAAIVRIRRPGSRSVRISIFIFVVMAATLAGARADTITTVDFEKIPAGTPGPALFTNAGGVETVDVPGVASITGGVVLGLAPALAGNPWATGPNIYATASDSVVGPGGFGLSDSIVIGIAPGTYATQATVPVINGMPKSEDYLVTAFDSGDVVWQQTLSNVQAFGYAVANVTAPAITSITIAAVDSSTWDFATDTITLRESSGRSTVTSTPEPASALLAIVGLAVAGAAGSLRRRYPASR